jgi:anti-sigma regulatory factor (Ser/Thr protein kinase)
VLVGRAVRVNSARRQSAGPGALASLQVGADLRAVRAARRFVRGHCAGAALAAEQCDDAVLLTSELVTNAVLHGRSEVCVEVRARDGALRVAVLDENSRRPAPVAEDPDALDGRGLALVDALADRWGVEERPIGKAVWFEVGRR